MPTDKLKKIIAEERIKMGLTQEELAKRINVSTSTISLYETGARVPNITIIEKLCSVFHVSIDHLTGYAEDEPPEPEDDLRRVEKGVNRLLSAMGYFSDETKKVVEIPFEEYYSGLSEATREEIKKATGGNAFVKDEIHLLTVWNDSKRYEIPFDDYLEFVDHLREEVETFLEKENRAGE